MHGRALVVLLTLGTAVTVFACRDITAPTDGRTLSHRRLINGTGSVVVSPGDMHGWSFYDDQPDSVCTDGAVCRFVQGPGTPPAGGGSAELVTPLTANGKALLLADYKGTRFDSITDLRYATYRQSVDSGNNMAVALQLNVDYDLTDQSTGYQGRMVFEPYQGIGGNVPQSTWQSWDAKAGKWWGTKSSVPVNGAGTANLCVHATPCTWTQLLATFPNIGVHSTYGAVVLKAGSSWPGFRGNVDNLTIGVSGVSTTFDFELNARATVPLAPPDTAPRALFESLGTVTSAEPGVAPGPYRRDIVILAFKPHTPLPERQAAIDSIAGQVVGGHRNFFNGDGSYYVRISGGTFGALVEAVGILQRQPQVSYASWWGLAEPDIQSYLRPSDGDGWKKADWKIDPAAPDASRGNWALEYVRAPMAWGCDTGSAATAVAVADFAFQVPDNIKTNVDGRASSYVNDYDASDYALMKLGRSRLDHGTRVASVIAAVGNDEHGMTGMAWHARLILRDARSLIAPPDSPVVRASATYDEYWNDLLRAHLVAAGLNGASVISMSLNRRSGGVEYDPSNKAQLEEVTSMRQVVSRAIAELADASRYPLFVLSAGNNGQPFEAGGYSAAKYDYPNQVLVIGGLDVDGSAWSHSNTGADVYAPAVKVAQATGTDDVLNVDMGTSFSAPLAAGVAVLLKDFDSSLTAADLVRLIQEGARTEGGLKKLDAYESLRRAARRPGAPLCGNRVYASHGALVAQRGDGVETLGDIGDFAPGFGNASINVKHGGRRIEVYAYPNKYAYDYSSTGWTRTAIPYQSATMPGDGGTYNGTFSMTHEGDSSVYLRRDATSLRLLVSDTISWEEQQIGIPFLLPTLASWSSYDCDILRNTGSGYFCGSFGYERGGAQKLSPVRSTVNPIDGALYASIGFQTDSEIGPTATTYNCSPEYYQTYDRCTGTRYYQETNDSLVIYRVDRFTGSFTRLGSLSGAMPLILTVSEDGRELLLNYHAVDNGSYEWKTIGYNDARVETELTTHSYLPTCVTVAIPITRNAQGVTLGEPTQLAREQGGTCPVANSMLAIPTYSPSRSPSPIGSLRP